MTPRNNALAVSTAAQPVLRHKPAQGLRYGKCSPLYMSMVKKWRAHFQGVILKVLAKAGRFAFPMDFKPLELYMQGFETIYLDIKDADLLGGVPETEKHGEGWHYISMKDGLVVIFYDPHMPHRRTRFTKAHEWGHIFQMIDEEFRADMEAIPDPKERDAIIESIANHFAADYLMPHYMLTREIREVIAKYGVNASLAMRLAPRFDVSEVAMQHRLTNYNARVKKR